MKFLLKKILNKYGYQKQKPYSYPPIINYFKTNHSKNLLLSYLTSAFSDGYNYSHTAYKECFEIGVIFNELGYNVDVVLYTDDHSEIDYEKYDLIFGFGDPLCNSFYNPLKPGCKIIYYGTGCHINFQNPQSLTRILEGKQRTGKYLPESGRIVEKSWSLQTTLVDGMIILGNKHTVETYRKNYKNGKIITIPTSFHKVYDINLKDKDFKKSKHNFLWFGSSGMIHKGLDILLEVFKNRKNITLHVGGPVENEKRFKQVYYDYLFKRKNIITHGFIDISSEKFKELMDKCAFVIFPSASEGASPTVLTAMGNGGLIPIISKACGLDVEPFGFVFEKPDIRSVEYNINKALQLSAEEIHSRSEQALKFSNKNHSFDNFSVIMREAIKKMLDI